MYTKNAGPAFYRGFQTPCEGRKTTLKPSEIGRNKFVGPSSHMNFKFTYSIHKTVKYQRLIVCVNNGGKPLKKALTIKERKELQNKMAKVFNRNIKGLSAELQRILLDDLVTAFQNRMNVLIRAQAKRSY
jgi:hypothetical protein